MLAIPSLFAALTIAGAFWVGVLAARRLRDLGEGDRALAEGDLPLALPPARGGPGRDAATQRIRERVALRLQGGLRDPATGADRGDEAESLELEGIRAGDVVSIDGTDPQAEGDYVVEGVLRLREGSDTRMVLIMADGAKERWLVGGTREFEWLFVEPLREHGLRGEPPRNLELRGHRFNLRRRGQAAVAALGHHDRPEARRVSTYVYEGPGERLAWLERWGDEVRVGEGAPIPARAVVFLPGS